jgi:hypothetical protein
MEIGTIATVVWPCALTLFGCGYREIPPPHAPAQSVPLVEAVERQPPSGHTRVLLDTNGTPAKVTEIVSWGSGFATAEAGGYFATGWSGTEQERPLCLTPCLTELSRGLHRLRFAELGGRRGDDIELQVGSHSKVVRISLGQTEPEHPSRLGAELAIVVGVAAMATGSLALATASTGDTPNERIGTENVGVALLGTGAALIVIGIPWLLLTRGVHQPSTVTQFEY